MALNFLQFSTLHNEVFDHILHYLPETDRGNLSLTCKKLQEYMQEKFPVLREHFSLLQQTQFVSSLQEKTPDSDFGEESPTQFSNQWWKIDVPHDGSCLIWAIALAYLIPSKNAQKEVFSKKIKQLFGNVDETTQEHLKQVVESYNPWSNTMIFYDPIFKHLVVEKLRARIVELMEGNKAEFEPFYASQNPHEANFEDYLSRLHEPSAWLGELEIKAASLLLNCHIYLPNKSYAPENEEGNLVELYLLHTGGYHYQFLLNSQIACTYLNPSSPDVRHALSSSSRVQAHSAVINSNSSRKRTLSVSGKLAKYILSQKLGTPHSLLGRETYAIYKSIFDCMKPLYSEDFHHLEKDFTSQSAENLFSKIGQVLFNNFFKLLCQHQHHQQLPPSLQKILSRISSFYQEGRFPNAEELEEMASLAEEWNHDYLSIKINETGISASTLDEFYEKQNLQKCRDFLSTISENFDVQAFLESVLRSGFTRSFFKILKSDIQHYFAKKEKNKTLFLLDHLIDDYISTEPSAFWRTTPDFNYYYHIPVIDHLFLDDRFRAKDAKLYYQRMETAGEIIATLEAVLDGFLLAQEYRENLFANLPWIIFENPALLIQSYKDYRKEGKPKITDRRVYAALTGFLKVLLSKIPQYCAWASQNPKAEKFLAIKIRLFLSHDKFPSPNEILPKLDDTQTSILNAIEKEWFDNNFIEVIQKAALLRDARNPEGKQKNLPMLGIGFSGPLFEFFPIEERKNCVFLNFTEAFRSKEKTVAGAPILYAISIFQEKAQQKEPALPYQICIVESIDAHSNDVIKYIAHQSFDFLCRNPNRLHADVRKSMQRAILDRVQSEYESIEKGISARNKKLQEPRQRQNHEKFKKELLQLNKDKAGIQILLQLIESENFAALTDAHKDFIKGLIDKGEKRICVETVISQFSGNPFTFAFAMGSEVGEPILLGDTPFTFKHRFLVQPCLTRCQLVGLAHTLWGDLNHLPTVQQADERAYHRQGKRVKPLPASKLRSEIRSFLQSMQEILRITSPQSINSTEDEIIDINSIQEDEEEITDIGIQDDFDMVESIVNLDGKRQEGISVEEEDVDSLKNSELEMVSMEEVNDDNLVIRGFSKLVGEDWLEAKVKALCERNNAVCEVVLNEDNKSFIEIDTNELFSGKKKVFLINHHMHYSLFVINAEGIFRYNSLYIDLNALEKFFLSEKIGKELTDQNGQIHQKDGWSCGFHVLHVLELLLTGFSLNDVDIHPLSAQKLQKMLSEYVRDMNAQQEAIPKEYDDFYNMFVKSKSIQELAGLLDGLCKKLTGSEANQRSDVIHRIECVLIGLWQWQKKEKNAFSIFMHCIKLTRWQRQVLYKALEDREWIREALVNKFLQAYLETKGEALQPTLPKELSLQIALP